MLFQFLSINDDCMRWLEDCVNLGMATQEQLPSFTELQQPGICNEYRL